MDVNAILDKSKAKIKHYIQILEKRKNHLELRVAASDRDLSYDKAEIAALEFATPILKGIYFSETLVSKLESTQEIKLRAENIKKREFAFSPNANVADLEWAADQLLSLITENERLSNKLEISYMTSKMSITELLGENNKYEETLRSLCVCSIVITEGVGGYRVVCKPCEALLSKNRVVNG